MIAFPNVKINLGLNILSKRQDGYHNLQSIFYPVSWCDILEIVKSDSFHFETSGIEIPGDLKDNLVLKAYNLLKTNYNIGPVSIWLHKVVPTGAGLGGGSSNGVSALKLLNELFELRLTNDQLKHYAIQLGSDCSFFVENSPCHVSGRGEILQKVHLNLLQFWIKIVHPGIHISTKEAFAKISPNKNIIDLLSINYNRVSEFKNQFINDFEYPIFHHHPEISKIKESLLSEGAFYASMSGSGSAVYGLFQDEPKSGSNGKFEFITKLQ